jgi:hypothetical protein
MSDRLPPPLPRQPSRSEVFIDLQPERGAVRHSGVDGVPQTLPKRSATLTGLPAPAAPGSKPPPVPRLPGELAPTLKAPPNPLQHKTIRQPAPPSAVAAARRTDPPVGIRVPPDEARSTLPPGSSLPPASLTPDAGSLEAVRRRAVAAETELAELKRQARVRAETASPATYPPPVSPPAAPAPVVVHHGVSTETLEAYRKAQTKLMLGIAGFLVLIGAPLALWLTNAATQAERDTKRTQVQATEAVKTSESAKVQTSGNDKELAELKAELAKFKLYTIALQRRQGVAIRLPEGVREEDLPKLEFEAPLRRPGVVKPGATLIVQTPP